MKIFIDFIKKSMNFFKIFIGKYFLFWFFLSEKLYILFFFVWLINSVKLIYKSLMKTINDNSNDLSSFCKCFKWTIIRNWLCCGYQSFFTFFYLKVIDQWFILLSILVFLVTFYWFSIFNHIIIYIKVTVLLLLLVRPSVTCAWMNFT